MCRKEMGPLEDMPQASESVDSDDSSIHSRNTEEAAEDERNAFYAAEDERNAFYAARAKKRYAALGDAAPAVAAKKIQSVIRMFLARSSYLSVRTNLLMVESFEKYLRTQKKDLAMALEKMRAGRVAWSVGSVTLIQAVWRGHRVRAIKAKSLAVKKIQALWRGYSLRNSMIFKFQKPIADVGKGCWVSLTHDGRRWVTTT